MLSNDNEVVPTPSKKSKTGDKEHAKQIWLITYASGSPNITSELLIQSDIQCDECYTITWRESKYTLIHSKNRFRYSKLDKLINRDYRSHGIVGSHITGYDTLSSNDEKKDTAIHEHPGFQKMVELMNQKSADLVAWIEHGDLLTYRKGLLWKYIESTDPKEKTRKQLMDQVIKWTPLIQEREALIETNRVLQATLNAETRSFLDLVQVRERNHTLTLEINKKEEEKTKLAAELEKSKEECTRLKSLLVRNGIDPYQKI